MTTQHTELTEQNLRIYKSQRLTDTDDGGGMMTREPLTGANNELFNPVSTLDNTMGGFDVRLVYPAVLTDNTASLLGANIIINQPPAAPNVSVLLVKGDHYGQERVSIMERMESYRTATTESRMTLLGKQRKGSRMVQVYQRENAPLPIVGQVLALRLVVDAKEIFEFIRITSFTHELRTFEDDKGEFVRRVLNLTVSQALERDFEGTEDAMRYKATPPARVMQTQIADSARYSGIKPLAKAVQKGSGSLKVDSLYEKLVPTSVVETAIADDWAQGKTMWIPTGAKRNIYSGYRHINSGSLFLECPVLPGSVELEGFTDDAQGTLKKGDIQLSIDYAAGVISGFNGLFVYNIYAIPAVQVRNYAYSASIAIDDTNVGTEWAPLLRPAPARGSVSVSFMAGKEWYELQDYGDYVLRDNNGTARGNITASGSLIISLPVQPDSGSKIVISWVPHEFYKAIDGQAAGQTIAPTTLNTALVLPQNPIPNLKPNTVKLTWAGGNAQDDGQGNLTGSMTGKVDYATGQFYPIGLNAAEVTLTAQQYSANATDAAVKVSVSNAELSMIAPTTMQAGSLKLKLWVQRQTDTGYKVSDQIWNATTSR